MAGNSENTKKKLGKYFRYAVDGHCVAHVILNENGQELARLQLSPCVGVLENTALVEEILESYYDYCKMLYNSRG